MNQCIRNKIVIIIIVLIAICSLCNGCSATVNANILSENDYSNIGNMFILSYFAQDGENTFYVDPNINILYKVTKEDYKMENPISLGDGVSKFFLSSNDVIYYLNKNDKNSIYSMNKNGNNKVKISSMTCNELISYQNRIYFTDSEGLYSMDYNGSNLKEIKEGIISNIYPYKSYLFYIQTLKDVPNKDIIDDQNIIYRFNIKENEFTKIGGISVWRFFVLNDHIYYVDGNDLYNMNTDGSEISQITKSGYVPKDTMNIYGNYLIYCNMLDGSDTYALDTKNGKIRRISQNGYQFIYVINDSLITDKGRIPLT